MNQFSTAANHDLEALRHQRGDAWLQQTYQRIVQENPARAASLCNQPTLSFPTLYILFPQIKAHHLIDHLSPRNQYAYAFAFQNAPEVSPDFSRKCLKWMFLTSMYQELHHDEFQNIIDRVAIQLLAEEKDLSVLPQTVDLIFQRNRNNECIYDLCWALAQCRSVSTMPLIANYIKSNEKKDYELAYKLLNFKPERQPKDRAQQFQNFFKWFQENQDFLYYANESMQETCQPKYWRVHLPAKYLCKSTSPNAEVSEDEHEKLHAFEALERPSQKLLSKHSYRMYRTNASTWEDWMKKTIEDQLNSCQKDVGGEL